MSWQHAMQEAFSTSRMLHPLANSASPAITVAIPYSHSGAWAAQVSFLRSVTLSLARTQHPKAKLLLLNFSGETGAKALQADVRDFLVTADLSVWKSTTARSSWLKSLGVDCVLNLFGPPPHGLEKIGLVGWIADFQHARLPQYFLSDELEARDRIFRETLDVADRIILSSKDAERDCHRFSPAHVQKTRVHPFPSGFAFQEMPSVEVGKVLDKYNIPKKFILVANQFWAHKNHLSVIESAKLLRERGGAIPIVLTGLPADYRDPANQLVSKVLQAISMAGLRDWVILLGQVPYNDLISLLRHAALVLQPSSFEGWSTTVQDAKALGRAVACSSISLHREQAPQAVGFFDPKQPTELVHLLEQCWPNLTSGPNLEAEQTALAIERQFATDYGIALWQTCAEAAHNQLQ
jgi:glycosyltransferase involved in cell wall biosynthesis